MSRIFLVSNEKYGDGGVWGAFFTQDEAEQFIAKIAARHGERKIYPEMYVEELFVGMENYQSYFTVHLEETGEPRYCSYAGENANEQAHLSSIYGPPALPNQFNTNMLTVTVRADSVDEANEKAKAIRQKVVDAGQWVRTEVTEKAENGGKWIVFDMENQGEIALQALVGAGQELLDLIDEVPLDPRLGDETDRVFPRYEFERLRAAVAKAKAV
jgi:hypothetical protein